MADFLYPLDIYKGRNAVTEKIAYRLSFFREIAMTIWGINHSPDSLRNNESFLGTLDEDMDWWKHVVEGGEIDEYTRKQYVKRFISRRDEEL
jgi:hypothetical protein